jgi:hypothetical protein
VLEELQLRLMQLGLRWNVTGNTMSSILGAVGDSLRSLNVLAAKPGDDDLPPVEGDDFGPAPARGWQNRFDRLREELCGMNSETVRLYAMCPAHACGKLILLDNSKLLQEAGQLCSRKLLSEVTTWPIGKKKPPWKGAEEEPVCGTLLTVKASSREPLLIFTYRPLQLSLTTVLSRERNQQKCEQWRQRRNAAAAAPPPPPPVDDHDDEEERKEYDRPRPAAAPRPAASPSARDLLNAARKPNGAAGSARASVEPFASLIAQMRQREKQRSRLTLEDAEAVLELAAQPGSKFTEMLDVYDGQLWKDMQHWRPTLAEEALLSPDLQHSDEPEPPDQDTEDQDERSVSDEQVVERETAEREAQAKRARQQEAEEERVRANYFYKGDLLAAPHTLALQLFVDWYQKHSQGHHSVGLIWACVLNLPREERYELHNMLLVGVLPGPHETSYTQLQGALQIFTAELRQLWAEGLVINNIWHRVFLFSVVCDTPAMRAVCGLGGASAVYGCPYCDGDFKKRPGKGQSHRDWRPSVTFKPDRSGLQHAALTHAQRVTYAQVWVDAHRFDDINAWLQHRRVENRPWRADSVAEYFKQHVFSEGATQKKKKSKQPDNQRLPDDDADLDEHEAAHIAPLRPDSDESDGDNNNEEAPPADEIDPNLGSKCHSTRWSALLDLPYFDSVRCVPIDVMHNLMLGLCKHFFAILTGHHDRKAKLPAAAAAGVKRKQDAAAASDAPRAKRNKGAAAAASTHNDDEEEEKKSSPAVPADTATVRKRDQGIVRKADLKLLQTSVASCNTPRDIGRMSSRLDSLDNIKAIEWLNLYAIFLVPVVRSWLPTHALIEVKHLTMVDRIATIVKLATSYHTTSVMIDELHEALRQIMLDVEALSPDTSSYISPNMHLSLHLKQQLLDHGPATSWWSMPYERMMGMASNIPFRPGRSSVDTARRALALLEVTAKATPQLEQQSVFGRYGIRLPAGPGFEHGVRRTDNGGRYHWYHFIGEQGNRAARLMQLHRLTQSDDEVKGCEPYPGLLFNSGQLFRRAAGGTRTVGLDSTPDMLKSPPPPGIKALPYVRRCLLAHHLTTRMREVHEVYAQAIRAKVAGSDEWKALRKEQQLEFEDVARNRVDVYSALLTDRDGQWRAAPARFQTVRTWYEEQGGDGWDRVDVFDKLFYAGEEFGSDIVSGGQNAWISANFAHNGNRETQMWYGRVSYYIRHTFAGRAHDFAAVVWFQFSEDKFMNNCPKNMLPSERTALQSTLQADTYPIVNSKPMDADIRDVIPVHRIVGRWIPMTSKHYTLVCPIRARTHG